MNFTKEQVEKAKLAKNAGEILSFAKENGIDLTEDEAKKYFADLHKEGAVADEELNNVSGGCGGSSKPSPKFKVGQEVFKFYAVTFDRGEIVAVLDYDSDNGYLYRVNMQNGDSFLVFLETRTDYIVR